MKKKILAFCAVIGVIAVITTSNSWAFCEPDYNCDPAGDRCSYACQGEVYVVGNMYPISYMNPIEPSVH